MKIPRIVLLLVVLSVSALAIVDDDLFTGGAPEKPQPKTKPDPSASEWDRLLDAAEGPALKLPETAQSEEQDRIRRSEWWMKNVFDAEIARSKGRPDEKEVRDFFDEMIPWFSNTGFPLFEQKTVKRCLEIAAGTVRRPAMDLVAARFLIQHGREADGVKLIRTVADAPDDAAIPPLIRTVAQADVLHWCDVNDRPSVPAAEERFYELIGRHLAEPCDDDGAENILAYHFNAPISLVWKGREARCFEAYKNAKLPDWARFALGGTYEMWLGNGKVALTNEARSNQLNLRYGRARELLTESWRLRPQSPWAARGMVEIVRRGQGGEDDTLRLWGDRALAASCDDTFAADQFLHDCLHSDGRGYGDMLAFGRACLETGRYDSALPAMFNRAVNRIASDLTDWRSIYRSPKVSALLLDTREKCLAGAKTDRIRLLHLSYLYFESLACGDYARAHKALLMLPVGESGERTIDNEVKTLCHRLNMDMAVARQDLLVRQSPAREAYEKGTAALAAGHLAEARAQFGNALKTAGSEPAKYLGSQIALANFQERFDAGGWVAVPLDERFLWHYSEGWMQWLAEEKKARLTSNGDFGKILFRGALGDSYEVRGHFRPQRVGARKTAGLSIFCGYSPETFGRHVMNWWVGRVDLDRLTNMTMDFAGVFDADTKLKQVIPYAGDNPFLMRRDKDRITFVCGGKRIDADIPADAPGGPGAFGTGVIAPPGFGYADVWDFEARKLTPANRAEDPLVTVGTVAIQKLKFAPVISGTPEEMAATVKALVAGSRWDFFGTSDFAGDSDWVELYKDGTARSSWATGHTWDIRPPNILELFQPGNGRHYRFDIDVVNRTGMKTASRDKNIKLSIRYDKAIDVIPPSAPRSMKLYVSGSNDGILTVNGKPVKKFGKAAAGTIPVRLQEGDIIAVRLGAPLESNSLWFALISPRGELLIETDERWKCYIPADKENWWDVKAPKDQKPVRFAPDGQALVANVKRAAGMASLDHAARPVRGDISDEPNAVFIYRIVTKADLMTKQFLTPAPQKP